MRCSNGFLPFLCMCVCEAHEPVASRGNDWPTSRAVSPSELAGATARNGAPAPFSDLRNFSMSNSPVRGTYEREYDK